MLSWIRKIIDLGTDYPALQPYQKYSLRIVNGICFFTIVTKVIGDSLTMNVLKAPLILHNLMAGLAFALILYLNYKHKIQLAKWLFTISLLISLAFIPFLVQHSLNADGIFLVIIVLFAAIFDDTKTILALSFIIFLMLVGWHTAEHFKLLTPIAVVGEKDSLYVEINYTFMMVTLLLVMLFSFKKNVQNYQKELTQNLHEKDILIKEVHHRVKNNLQIIASMISLQLDNARSEETKSVITDIKARVISMSIIHNKLYEATGFHMVELKDYIEVLSDLLAEMYSNKEIEIEKKITIEPMVVGLEHSIPLGLMVTELVANSMKHGFIPGKKALLEITGERLEDHLFSLKIKDNGNGIRNHETLQGNMGFMLLSILARQIQGKVERYNEQGLVTNITFKL